MMTPQQAYQLFVYADWAMMLAGVAMLAASLGWSLCALFPRNKEWRKRMLVKALVCFLMFALFWGTQASVLIAFFNKEWTPLLTVLFALPVVVMGTGLIASLGYGAVAVVRKVGPDRRSAVLKSLLGIVVFGLGIAPHTAAMLMPVLSYEDHSNSEGTLVKTGERVPDFQLTSVDGTPFQTADMRGNVVVLNFFATWCGPCLMELPHLQQLWDEFRNDNRFRLVVVGREETDQSVKEFRQKNGFTFPMAADSDRAVYGKFATQYIPRTYLISSSGIIVFETTGFYEPEFVRLKKLIREALDKMK